MPYIYKITNDINDKVYIGKTLQSIQSRWRQHCQDYKKERNNKRPLYSAMIKYGIEHFHIEQIEECDDTIINERECYWIEYFGSFKYGYNATRGGDGKSYIDYDLVVAVYQELNNIKETAKRLGISPDTVGKILKIRNIPIMSPQEIVKKRTSKPIQALDLNNNHISYFSSAAEAARFLVENNLAVGSAPVVAARLGQVANGKRKTAYKMQWKWVN